MRITLLLELGRLERGGWAQRALKRGRCEDIALGGGWAERAPKRGGSEGIALGGWAERAPKRGGSEDVAPGVGYRYVENFRAKSPEPDLVRAGVRSPAAFPLNCRPVHFHVAAEANFPPLILLPLIALARGAEQSSVQYKRDAPRQRRSPVFG